MMRRGRSFAAVVTLALSVVGCSGKDSPQLPKPDADVPPDAATPCEQLQRDYVNGILSPDPQTDVATTVSAVLGTADFHRAMPYCSGERPAAGSARAPTPRPTASTPPPTASTPRPTTH